MSGVFALIGDSNVRRHMSTQNCRDRPQMIHAQVKSCGHLDAFDEVVRSIKPEVTIVILACITNFITSSEGASTSASLRVEPVLKELRDLLMSICQDKPNRYAIGLFKLRKASCLRVISYLCGHIYVDSFFKRILQIVFHHLIFYIV